MGFFKRKTQLTFSSLIVVLSLVTSSLVSAMPPEKCSGDTYYIKFAPSQIRSPNYGQMSTYLENDRCFWSLEAPLNFVIRLDFLDFDLPSVSSGCQEDNLTIYDNSYGSKEPPVTPVPSSATTPSRKSPVTYCGSRLPPTYISTYNQVFLAFSSNSFTNGRGFNIRFDFLDANFFRSSNYLSADDLLSVGVPPPSTLVPPARCDDRRVILSQASGCISTPNYGFGSYASRDTCYWLISTEPGSFLKLRFETFALASTQVPCHAEPDRVILYSGENENSRRLTTLCGSYIPAPIDTKSNVLFVKFVSSGSRQLSGFKMCWESAVVEGCNASLVAPVNASAFSASSYFAEQVPALAKHPACCWSSRTPTEPGAFLQIDFKAGKLYRVNKLAIRGNPTTDEWVTRFSISYQSGGSNRSKWFDYHESTGFRKTFSGNVDATSLVYVKIEPPISAARAIRILPLAAHQWMSMTVDVFGCEDTVTYPRYSLANGDLYDPMPSVRCNGESRTLTAPSGFISTPGFPHPYSSNDVCSWRIVAPSTARVRLTSENFKMEDSYLCANDRLTVHDGSSASSPQLGAYCGTIPPPTLISSESALFLKFTTDGTVQDTGFRLHYDFVHRWEAGDNAAVDPVNHLQDYLRTGNEIGTSNSSTTERCGGQTIILTAIGGYVRSPRYGLADYPNTDLCYWQILGTKNTRVRLIFESFDVAQSNFDCSQSGDLLMIYDGADEAAPLIGSFCGRRQIDPVVLSKNVAYLKFKTNSRITASGFSIRYELIDGQSAISSVPSAPVGTVNGSRCAGRRQFMYDNNGLLFSPGFDAGAYAVNDQCYWTLAAATPTQRVRLAFRTFSVGSPGDGFSCPNDFMEIYDGPNEQASRVALLCGTRNEVLPGPITSSGRYLAIRFITKDAPSGAKGFAAYYSFIPSSNEFISLRRTNMTTTPKPSNDIEPTREGSCDGRYFVLQLNRGQVERIGTSTIAQADQCNWLITSPIDTRIQVSFVDFMLRGSAQCRADALSVYDGSSTNDRRLLRVCGSWVPDTIISTGPNLLIKFLTSTTRPEAYFHAIVKILGPGERPSEPMITAEPPEETYLRKNPVIETTTMSPYDRVPAGTTPSACQRTNPCPPNYRCVMHQGMGYCIPGTPYVPVDAETAAQLASNPFVEPDTYWDVSKWQQVVAVLATSTPSQEYGQPYDMMTQPPYIPLTYPPTTYPTPPTTTLPPPPPPEPETEPPPSPPPLSSSVATRCGGQSFVYVSTTQGTISSPGYDRSLPYPTQDSCFWQIEAPLGFTGVRLTLLDFDLAWSNDCTGDHLQIYDDHDSQTNSPDTLIATLCGTPRPTDPKAVFTTTGRRVAIAFYALTPGSQTHRGFNIAFSAVRLRV